MEWILKSKDMRIYKSTEYIDSPSIGDLKLKVNSMWDFSSRNVCFGSTNKSIPYDLEECIDVVDGIIIGGTRKVKNTKWKQAEITKEIIEQLKKDNYIISIKLTNPTNVDIKE